MDIRLQTLALREERMNVYNKLNACLDAVAGRTRNEEEKAEIARYDTRIDEIDAEVRDLDMRHTRETEAATLRAAQETAWGEIRTEKGAPNQIDELRAFLRNPVGKSLEIDIRGPRKERELIRMGCSPEEIRAIAWDTGSSASLVPTLLARTVYAYLEASIAALRMPTTKITTTNGDAIKFPRFNAHAIATQVSGQGTTLAGTDPTFLSMQLDAFKYAELVIVANEILSDAGEGIDIAGLIGRDIGRAIGRVVDIDFIAGSGSGKPNGLMTALGGAGTVVTGGSLITPKYEDLVNLVYSVNDAYRNNGSAAFLMKDSTAGTLRKLRDGAGGTVGAVLWNPSLTGGIQGGQPDRLLDYPVYIDPNVAAQGSDAKIVAYGDMSAFYIRTIGNPVIESDQSRYFDTDQTGFRGKWRVDSDLIDTTAINVLHQSVT